MIEQPVIVWKGANPANITSGRGGYAFEFLVLHIMEGTLEGCAAWFNDPRARASTHFGVGKDGRIWQFVDLADTAFAHGKVEVAYDQAPRVIKENWGMNPNLIGCGIEHEGLSGQEMTPAMFDASTRLAAWLFDSALLPGGASGVAVDRAHILRHGEISPSSRPRCPGFSEALVTRYVARVGELLSPAAPDPRDALLSRYRDAITVQATDLQRRAGELLKAGDALVRHGAALDQQAITLRKVLEA